MMPGGHTVTIAAGAITSGRLGATTTLGAAVTVSGCFMQPLHVSEKVTETDVAIAFWRCIAPAVPAALAVTATGEIVFNGDTYQITGSKPYSDFSGAVDHVTIECERQVG